MSTILIFAALLVLNLVCTALIIKLGSKWMKAKKPYFSRALLIAAAMWLVGMIVSVGIQQYETRDQGILPYLAIVLINGGVAIFLVKFGMQVSSSKSVVVWLFSLVPAIASAVFVIFILQPYITATYTISANNMAPTLRGDHRESVCPHCGGVRIESANKERMFVQESPGICASCFKISKQEVANTPNQTPDRILVNRLLTPNRWDLVTFKYEGNPSLIYVKRLVGLPGEKIYIKEGAIWINDAKIPLPDELKGLEYSSEESMSFGSQENPCVLSPNEYFVLGDFTSGSMDSRFFGPIPKSNLAGVITVTYWPKDRWKIWR